MKKLALALLLSAAADLRADVLTVGPTGGFARLEDALMHAVASPAPTHEIRVAEGTHAARLALPSACCGSKTLIVLGGWNADFSAYRVDPGLTVLDAALLGRVLDVPSMTSGTLALQNLTLRRGRVKADFLNPGRGGGIRAMLSGNARMALNGVHVRSNEIAALTIGGGTGPGSVLSDARGAGAYAQLRDGAVLLVDRSEFSDNAISAYGIARPEASGAGLHLQVEGGTATVRSSRFAGNRIAATAATTDGDALFGHVSGSAQLAVADTRFEGATSTSGTAATVWTFGSAGTGTAASIARCRFVGNASRQQLQVRTFGTRRIVVSDTLVADGVRDGVSATAWSGTIHLTNLTVTRHPGAGVRTDPSGGIVTLHNTIAWQNVPNLAGTRSSASSNLAGVDPLFVDAAEGDFGLGLASPAIDEGTNAPPAGLGARDAAGNPRVANGRVDIGAFERAH